MCEGALQYKRLSMCPKVCQKKTIPRQRKGILEIMFGLHVNQLPNNARYLRHLLVEQLPEWAQFCTTQIILGLQTRTLTKR